MGPALLVAIGIASQRPQSEIILCTDGLPNVGLGAMDTPPTAKVYNLTFKKNFQI